MQEGFTKLHSVKKLGGKSLQPSEPTSRADWSGACASSAWSYVAQSVIMA